MRGLFLLLSLACVLVSAPPVQAGGLAGRLLGRTEHAVAVDGKKVERTTRRFDRMGRLRRTVVDRASSETGVQRVTTERFRRSGELSSRVIDTKVASPAGPRELDHDVWAQAFGRDGSVALDLTIGQVGGKLAAYLLAGKRQWRLGTASEIHWDRTAMKLRYVTPGR